MLHVLRRSSRASMALALAAGSSCAVAQNIQFPPDANVINITTFGVVPGDAIDDTAGFQAALNATVATGRVLYLPNGEYKLSDRLNWGGIGSGGRFRLQGQSRDGVVLRLDDGAPGFGDPLNPKVFIDAYEGNTANQFRNYLQDVTINVGSNNPGVIALQFQSNNTGAIRNVLIRSAGPGRAGVVGLDLAFNFPGPFLAQDLTIEGFDEAIRGAPQEYSVTFDRLTIRNQNVRGMGFWRLPVQIRDLVSENSVPVLRNNSNPGAWGHIVIDGGTFTGGSPSNPAILNEDGAGVVVLRNVTTQGYALAMDDDESNPMTTVPGGVVAQYTTDAPFTVQPSPASMLPLSGADAPALPDIPLSQWASVKTFGAIEDDNLDDTLAIQAAFASGASVVYFPSGLYYISDTIEVGPTVVRVEGLLSDIRTNAPLAIEPRPMLRIGKDAQPIVHISGLNQSFQSPGFRGGGTWIEHAKANTLVIRDGDIQYRNTVSGGKVFLENVVGNDVVFEGQQVWAKQLNPEGSGITKVINDAGDLYILGLKTEGDGTVLETRNRGRSLVLGGLIYPSSPVADRTQPMFRSIDSSLSFTVPESCYIADGNYNVWVRETRGGSTVDLPRSSITRGHAPCGGMISLFNGWQQDATPGSTPGSASFSATTTSGTTLTWPASTDAQSGIARYNIYRNGAFLRATTNPTLVEQGLPDDAIFQYRVSSVNGAGIESAQSIAATIQTLADDTSPRVTSVEVGRDPRFITVRFSEPISPSNASNPSNYDIAGPSGVTVLSAGLLADGTSVRLTAAGPNSGLGPGLNQLAVSNVTDRASSPNAIAPSVAAFSYANTSGGTGLQASFWGNRDFLGAPITTRVDPNVNATFAGSPAAGVPADGFAIRWVGRVRPRFSETTTISMLSDDGCRVFLDGRLILGRWIDQSPTLISTTLDLDSSRDYDLVVEHYDAAGGATAVLSWQSASLPLEVIPTDALSPVPLLTTVRTTQGQGAETSLDRVGPGEPGTGNSFGTFHSPAAGAFHSAGYFRFDLATFNLASNYAIDGVATLTQTFFGIGSGKRQINFFGVRQSANGDNWIESGPGFVTWATAAGNDGGGSQGSPTTSRWIDTFLLDNTNFQNNNQHDKASFGGPRLLEMVGEDTDGLLTFLCKRVDASNEGQSWFTKEWGIPGAAPALKLQLAPRCPQVVVQPIAPSGGVLSTTGVVLSVRATGAPPLAFQWRRNGVPLVAPGADSSAVLVTDPCAGGAYDVVISNTCGTATSAAVTIVGAGCGPTCDSLDINNDGSFFDPQDIDAFLSVFSEGPCVPEDATCNDIDFNNDGGLFDPCDIDSFLLVFSEGPCTLCGV